MKSPHFSGAYHTPKTFFVVSYESAPNLRELVSETFTNAGHARCWVNENQRDYDGELLIHPAKFTGVLTLVPEIVAYEAD